MNCDRCFNWTDDIFLVDGLHFCEDCHGGFLEWLALGQPP